MKIRKWLYVNFWVVGIFCLIGIGLTFPELHVSPHVTGIIMVVAVLWCCIVSLTMPPADVFKRVEELQELKRQQDESWDLALRYTRILGQHEAIRLYKVEKNAAADNLIDHRMQPFLWMYRWLDAYDEGHPGNIRTGEIIKDWIKSLPELEKLPPDEPIKD